MHPSRFTEDGLRRYRQGQICDHSYLEDTWKHFCFRTRKFYERAAPQACIQLAVQREAILCTSSVLIPIEDLGSWGLERSASGFPRALGSPGAAGARP